MKRAFLIVILVLIIIVFGLYWLTRTDYKQEFTYLLNDYETDLIKTADFIVKNRINEITYVKANGEFLIKGSTSLNNEQNQFINLNMYSIFNHLVYISWDTWGLVGGKIQISKVQRFNKSILFYCYDVRAKKNNLRLVYAKKNAVNFVYMGHKLKKIKSHRYYFEAN